MNTITLIGNATGAPKRFRRLVAFTVADNKTIKREGEKENIATFFECVMFGENLEWVDDIIHRGARVCVTGEVYMDKYKETSKLKMVVSRIISLEKRQQAEAESYAHDDRREQAQSAESAEEVEPMVDEDIMNEDLPF